MSVNHYGKGWRCYVSYKDPDGKYKQKAGKVWRYKKQAEEEEAHIKASLGKIKKQDVTFGLAFDKWCKDSLKSGRHTERTNKRHKGQVIKHFENWWDIPLAKFTKEFIMGEFNKESVQKLTETTQIKLYGIIKALFNFCVDVYGIPSSLPNRMTVTKGNAKKSKKVKTPVSPADFGRFIKCVDDDTYKNFYIIVYLLGLRVSEAIALTFEDYDSVDNTVSVVKQYYDGEFHALKTDSSARVLTIPSEVVDIINHQLTKYKDNKGFSLKWFVCGGQKPLPYTSIKNHRVRAIKESGVPYFDNHTLRHSCATNYAAVNSVPILTSRFLGHSNTAITEAIYTHINKVDFSSLISATWHDVDNVSSKNNNSGEDTLPTDDDKSD